MRLSLVGERLVTVRLRGGNEDADRHINELELLAAFYALQCFVESSRRISVRLFLDNTTAVCYINKSGGTRSPELTAAAKLLSSFCESRSLTIEAVFLAGKLNVIADRESRASEDASDWMLDPRVFYRIDRIWLVNTDLFSAAWKKQLPSFVSWRRQPGALAVNAFSVNWHDIAGYIFPPFSLIGRCLEKVKREKANVVFVCPAWPSQPWFPLLLEQICDIPRLLPASENLLIGPQGHPHPLLLSAALPLVAWRLSGRPSDAKAFRKEWSTYCWPQTDLPLSLLTIRRGEIGAIDAIEGVKIPCLPL